MDTFKRLFAQDLLASGIGIFFDELKTRFRLMEACYGIQFQIGGKQQRIARFLGVTLIQYDDDELVFGRQCEFMFLADIG